MKTISIALETRHGQVLASPSNQSAQQLMSGNRVRVQAQSQLSISVDGVPLTGKQLVNGKAGRIQK